MNTEKNRTDYSDNPLSDQEDDLVTTWDALYGTERNIQYPNDEWTEEDFRSLFASCRELLDELEARILPCTPADKR